MEELYTVSNNKTGNDCDSDHELLIAKFRLKSKKVGKTTRPFMYDLNQISCDYAVKVTSRFEGFDLVDRVSEELWTVTLYRRQWPKQLQRKRNARRQSGCLRRLYK